ncbi:hypothetical protein ACF0H5_007752 [Mactra antiquata]
MSHRYGIKQSLKKLAVKYVPPKLEEPKKPEHLCSPCTREREENEATSYCVDCNEKLCFNCTTQHKKFQILKTHKILNVSEAPRKEVHVKEKHKLTDRCETHSNKLLDLYCTDHDDVGCAACIAIKHKECPEAVHISKTSVGLSKTKIPKDTKDEISAMKKEVFMVKLKRLGDKRRIKKQRDDILEVINTLRARINDIFDRLEEEAKEKLKTKYENDMKGINRDVRICDEALAALDDAMKKMKAENDLQLFINIKKDAKRSINRGQSVSSSVTNNIGQENVNFTVDESLEEWLNNIRALGKFDHEQSVYKGVIFGKYEVDLKSDAEKENYAFNGLLNLPDGNTVIADWSNRRLKLIDINYFLRGHCDLPGEPYNLCHINNNLIAVTLRDEKTIQLVGIDNLKMKLDRRLKLDEYCRGIAYKSNHLYVTVGGGEGEIQGQLRVYSLHGALVRVYEVDAQGKPFFISPKDVIISDDGSRFFVSDLKRGVVILTKDGRLVAVFNDLSLKSTLSLCINGKGDLFISGSHSNNIIQITADGKKIGEVLNENDGIERPLAICCHESVNTRLLVTSEGSYTMKVFTLQEKT